MTLRSLLQLSLKGRTLRPATSATLPSLTALLALSTGLALADSNALFAAEPQSSTSASADHETPEREDLDVRLSATLERLGFTGRIEETFHQRLQSALGRPIDPKLANLGRLLWFDKLHSLHQDNTCGGCHSPTNGFGDSQPMAIGVQNNNLIGPDRAGPRNQRRTPLVINTALYPAMMWNGRFNSLAGDPFDNRLGFRFPFPEDDTRFSFAQNLEHDVDVLLQAQAHMPPTELTEVAGYTGTCPHGIPDPVLGPAFCQFDDGRGLSVPLPDATGSRNEPIRQKSLAVLNATVRGSLSGSGRRPTNRFLHVRQGHRRIRVHPGFCQCAARPLCPGRSRGDDHCAEARGAPVLRQGWLRAVPRRIGSLFGRGGQ